MSLFWRNGYEKYLGMLEEKWESTSFRFMLVLATNKGYFRKFECYKSKVTECSKSLKWNRWNRGH
jgi:hypothetical protein